VSSDAFNGVVILLLLQVSIMSELLENYFACDLGLLIHDCRAIHLTSFRITCHLDSSLVSPNCPSGTKLRLLPHIQIIFPTSYKRLLVN